MKKDAVISYFRRMKNFRLLLLASIAILGITISCGKSESASLEVRIVDEAGSPVANAEVNFYRERNEWAAYENGIFSDPLVTDAQGTVRVELPPGNKYFVNVISGERNNRFGKKRTDGQITEGETLKETIAVRPPTEWERILSGGDHLVWRLAPLMTPGGDPFLDYPVDTDMYIDGRWLDSNGRLGLWWFNEDETKIYYDYATSGAVVASEMVSLTPELFRAKIDFFGIVMLIDMYPV